MTRLGENGPIVIVGGGPCGSLLAIYLAEQGHDVTLYESRPDMRRVDIDAGRSINLALATRGIVPLVEVDVIDRVDAITIPMKGRMIHAEGVEQLTLQPYGVQAHEVIHSISRGDLNAILLDRAEATGRVTVMFEQRCRAVDFARSVLTFTGPDGASNDVSFGNLFAADGAGSDIREAMMAVNGGTEQTDWLGHGYKEITLPAAADGGFQLNPNALHIWPRGEFMLIALANPEGDFTVTLFAPNEGPESFAALTTDEEVNHFFNTEFPDFAALVPDLATQFFDNPTGRLATMRATGWSHGDQAVVVGDAAHAIVPFHGQGMNLAMESARALGRHLAEQPGDVAGAFRSFEAERKPSADAIADMALDNYIEMRAGVVDPDYMIKRELALELERRHPERLRPRYNMVMFSTMPYAEAQRRAMRQADMLTELTADCDNVSDVDFERAATLVATLDPLPPLDPAARPDALSVT
jgi:kynurenine 3-monooxygenase